MDKDDITHTNASGGEKKDLSDGFLKLPDFYRKYGYEFKLVERRGDVAIFEQTDDGRVIAYEVFEIRKYKEREFFGKKIEPKESPPSSEQWGANAYTVHSLDRAIIRMEEIINNIRHRSEKSDTIYSADQDR